MSISRSGLRRLHSFVVLVILVLVFRGPSPALGAQLAAPVTDVPQLRTKETIDVTRIVIDAHVADLNGNLITDLGPADFHVLVDGKDAVIESVDWIDELPEEEIVYDENEHEVSRTVVPAPGRLFICFVQTDFARNAPRVIGEMKVIDEFHRFVEMLQPNDRVALLSFDSHLKLRLDFTTDRQQLQQAFPSVLLIDEPPPPPPVASPSLARLIDSRQMKNSPTSEQAFILLAHALGKIDGPKKMVLFAWGLSEPFFLRPTVNPTTLRAAAELAAARVTVDTFNFGLGGEMSPGLKTVAADTGGFYEMFDSFGSLPRLKAELQGHYEIVVRDPVTSVPGTRHRIDVRTARKELTVRAKKLYVDQP
jgi:VWFA-related protein